MKIHISQFLDRVSIEMRGSTQEFTVAEAQELTIALNQHFALRNREKHAAMRAEFYGRG